MTRAPLPEKFKWLADYTADGHPSMVVEALKLYGLKEQPGEGDNPEVMALAKEVGLETIYKHDSIAWCGLLINAVAKRAGKAIPEWKDQWDPLRAAQWKSFGTEVHNHEAAFGDVLIFQRPGGGHVGLYVGESLTNFFVLGGNQADQVNIVPIGKDRLRYVRRPAYKSTPQQVRKVKLEADGTPPSINEA